jgi:xanthine dehydrogenase accessory factor
MMVWASLLQAVESAGEAALISVVRAFGSTPREAGARMIVTAEGIIGTIGGGTLEFQAIKEAREQLGTRPSGMPVTRSQALGPDLGQCCGGRVDVVTEVFSRVDRVKLRDLAERESTGRFALTGRIVAPDFIEYFGERRGKLYLFGAGHVGHAVVTAMTPLIETSLTASALPLSVVWVDSRSDCFDRALPPAISSMCLDDPVALVADIPPGSFVLIMTHSHALDYDLTAAALRHGDLAYIGLIGSATKRARFIRRFRDDSIAGDRIAALTCPIGLTTIHSKHPAAIAAGVAAELLTRMEGLASTSVVSPPHVELLARKKSAVTEACCGGQHGDSAVATANRCAGCQPIFQKIAVASLESKIRNKTG